jgi:hypothetical protein
MLCEDAIDHGGGIELGINDSFADAIQLWSAVFSSLGSFAHQVASALQLHQTLTFTAKPHALKTLQQPAALAASAALATESPPETTTTSGSASDSSSPLQQPQTTGPPEAISDQTTQSPFVKSPDLSPKSAVFSPQTLALATPPSAFVTQAQFNAALSTLGASVRQLLAKTNTNPVPEYIGGDGNNLNPYAAASNIGQLSNVTITNANLTASEIPTGTPVRRSIRDNVGNSRPATAPGPATGSPRRRRWMRREARVACVLRCTKIVESCDVGH